MRIAKSVSEGQTLRKEGSEIRRVVVTVHGIRTFGRWQERFAKMLEERDPSIQVFSYKYGYFSVFAFLVPFLRWLVTRRFRLELLRIAHLYSGARIDIVAHSFGTHLVGWGVRGIPTSRRPKIHTIILAGSVLRPDFPWGPLLDAGSVYRLVNECGKSDWVLVLNQLVVLLTGMAGRIGFNGMLSARFRNNWYSFGHSDYFSDEFMSVRWVPLLASEELVPPVDERSDDNLERLMVAILQNAEPLKLAAYVIPLILACLYFYILFTSERNLHNTALAQKAVLEAEVILAKESVNYDRAILLAIESSKRFPSVESSQLLQMALPLLRKQVYADFAGPVSAWAFDTEGHYLAAGTLGGTVRIWERKSNRELTSKQFDSRLDALALSAGGKYLAVSLSKGVLSIWELPSFRHVRTFTGAWHTLFGFSPIGNFVLFDAQRDQELFPLREAGDYGLRIWDVESNQKPRVLTLGEVGEAAFRGDGQFIAASEGGLLRIWNVKTFTEEEALPLPGYGLGVVGRGYTKKLFVASKDALWVLNERDMEFKRLAMIDKSFELFQESPDGGQLAVLRKGAVSILSTADGKSLRSLGGKGIEALAFAPDGQTLATSDGSGSVQVWELSSGREVARLSGGIPYKGAGVAFSPDGRFVASGNWGGFQIWDMNSSAWEVKVSIPGIDYSDPAFSPSGALIALGFKDYVGIWEVQTGREVIRLKHEAVSSGVNQISFSSDGEFLAASFPLLTRIWNTSTWKWIRDIPHDNDIEKISLGPHGRFLAGWEEKAMAIRLWDVSSGKLAASKPHDTRVTGMGFSLDGSTLVFLDMNDVGVEWRIDTRTESRIFGQTIDEQVRAFFRTHPEAKGIQMKQPMERSVSFCNGTRFVAATSYSDVSIWDVEKRLEVTKIGNSFPIQGISLSSDARFLALTDMAAVIHIFDTRKKLELYRLNGMTNPDQSKYSRYRPGHGAAVLDSSGKRMATVSSDGVLHLMLWQPQDLRREACALMSRKSLDDHEWGKYFDAKPAEPTCPQLP